MKGKVWIVGAGPGDPGLLTVKGAACLRQADVVIYDRLTSPGVLSLAPATAELIDVGKTPGGAGPEQSAINALLISKATEGKKVVRLKNGDPFVFGRGGEEAEALAAAGVPFEIVPGISSAFAVPAYAGIPLTDRRFASSFAVAVGHTAFGKDGWEGTVDFRSLAGADTVVALMAASELTRIGRELIGAGVRADTPAAVIERGATPRQKTIVTNLDRIASGALEGSVRPPVVLVVGWVVSLRDRIAWYENLPLFGLRILVTRAEEQQEALAAKVEELGAEAVRLPLIEIQPSDQPEYLLTVVQEAVSGHYQWIVFTSTHGVRTFFEFVRKVGADARSFTGTQFAVIGPATRDRLQDYGVTADEMPSTYTTDGLVSLFRELKEKGRLGGEGVRILLWRAHGARDVLPASLKEMGCLVKEVSAYRTVTSRPSPGYLHGILREPIDVITFTSPSTVRGFFEVFGDEEARRWLQQSAVAVIGPITAGALREKGREPDIISEVHTIDGLVERLIDWASEGKREGQQE
ncbi:MAG: uroporphyrinogen-III C-methyltransferase [Armatimonadetes bacterium]|nr:uroporphyrinogen-III C-methyltransferase [Armatimonadota bacterium]MDW8122031.1 uroporphyrinogen-III C-methyltransferase [Armatimonadota bacterium]